MITIKCKKCGKEKKKYPSRLKHGNGKFCSRHCSNSYNNSGKKNHFSKDKYNRKGKDSPNWKGGKHLEYGYIVIYKPDHPFANKNGYIRENRLVMEKKLGRYLDPEEIVHHMNHIKTDNRPENLMLIENNSKHIKMHKFWEKRKNYKKT